MFTKIPSGQDGIPPLPGKLKTTYGEVSIPGPSESLWAWRKGKSVSAVFCLFPREWESKILRESRWGLKWAAGRSLRELGEAVGQLPKVLRGIGAASVAVRIPMSGHPFVQLLERTGFHYVGGLVTLKMTPAEEMKPLGRGGIVLRKAEKKDLLPLARIAHEAFKEGRFYHEPGLKPGGAKKIYSAWARNMLNYADEVKVAARRGPLGFISLKRDAGGKRLWIDLIAVDPSAQSRGIGSLLAAESRWAASRQKGWTLAVKTEPENLGALRFYLKNGFELESFHLDYIWRSEGPFQNK